MFLSTSLPTEGRLEYRFKAIIYQYNNIYKVIYNTFS